MSKKNIRILSVLAITIVVLLVIIIPQINFGGNDDTPEKSSQRQNAQALAIKAIVVKDTLWTEELNITGTILPNEQVQITGETSGKITSINFNEGEKVHKGQLLVQISNDELQARLQRTEYQVQLAQDREQRQKKLLDIGGISQEDYDRSKTEHNTLKAEAQELKAMIAKTRIRAPFEGTVGLRQVSLGSYISSGTVITTLVDIDPVKLEFTVPEKYSPTIKKGSKINFTITGSNQNFEGEVYAIEPRVEAATRALRIRAIAQNTKGELIPGRFANIQLELDKIPNAVFVPSHAIVSEMGGQRVFVFRNGKAVKTEIETGIRTAENVQVTDGLQPGDTVITTGLLQLRPGADVTIKEPERN